MLLCEGHVWKGYILNDSNSVALWKRRNHRDSEKVSGWQGFTCQVVGRGSPANHGGGGWGREQVKPGAYLGPGNSSVWHSGYMTLPFLELIELYNTQNGLYCKLWTLANKQISLLFFNCYRCPTWMQGNNRGSYVFWGKERRHMEIPFA